MYNIYYNLPITFDQATGKPLPLCMYPQISRLRYCTETIHKWALHRARVEFVSAQYRHKHFLVHASKAKLPVAVHNPYCIPTIMHSGEMQRNPAVLHKDPLC